ncbi:YesL family protein [Humibacter antri]
MQGASTFVSFVVLNVLFIVTCIPVVTIGMATSALFEVTIRYSDEEGGGLVRDYFRALKTDARRGTVVFACFALPALVLAFSGLFWAFSGSAVSIAAVVVALIGVLYFFAAFLYGTALVGRFESSLRQTLKNAMLLPVAESWRTFVLVIVPATAVSLAAVFPAFVIVIATIGFSVGAYTAGFLLRSVFARHAQAS